MAERNPPVWMQAGTYNAADDRLITGLLAGREFDANGALLGIGGGVVPPLDQLRVTAVGNNMVVNVSAGAVVIPALGLNPPGAYVCYNEGTTSLTLDIASGQPRWDAIYCEVKDQAVGDDTSIWRIAVKKGNPASSPVPPDLPANTIRLANVSVLPAAQNNNQNKITSTQINDLRLFYSAQGGIHLNFGGGMPRPNQVPGRLLYLVDKKSLYVSDGANWEPMWNRQEWLTYFKGFRPRHVISDQLVRQQSRRLWDPTLPKGKTGSATASAVKIADMICPLGYATVNLQAYGQLLDTADQNRAHISVRAFVNGTGSLDSRTKFAPTVSRGVSFYAKTWQHIGSSFMVTGLPTNVGVTFQVEFLRDCTANTNGTAYFDKVYLMVEPGR